MTSQQQRLEELQQQAKTLAEQIKQLQDQLNNTQPTTGLLGRWARHEEYGHVLIASQHANKHGGLFVAYPDDGFPDGADGRYVDQRDLSFPEQTTRPEDVPVGEAWLVTTCDGVRVEKNVVAFKLNKHLWVTGDMEGRTAEATWLNDEVELITHLIPARPHDTPETVTTEEEYEALPEGSVVAKNEERAWTLMGGKWQSGTFNTASHLGMEGTPRQVLRRGWGE